MIDIKLDMLLTFSQKAFRLMSLCPQLNFVPQLWAVHPAIAGCTALNWKT
jgi:hypothetical protein|nr:MAG TPA: hypothetical protein [Crassvirales sp.]